MSVVISAPQAPQATAATSASSGTSADNVAISFASLLRGQLGTGGDLQSADSSIATKTQPQDTALILATFGLPLEKKITDDVAVETEASPQDAASMLAALGMLPVERTPRIAPDASTTAIDGSAAGTVGVGPGMVPAGQGIAAMTLASEETISRQSGKSENILSPILPDSTPATSLKDLPANEATPDANATTGNGNLIATLGQQAEVKPAKIAVADLTSSKAEALAASNLADETRANNTAGVAPQAPMAALRNEEALKIETTVRDHTWATDFSQKVVWLATNDKQVAQITLNPPQMGPIEISLNLNKDGVSAVFASQNAEVRDAIETALPRLREMLAGAGIELGQTNVSAESFRQQASNDGARQGTPRWVADNAILGDDSARNLSGSSIIAQRGNGLVDTFA